VRVVGWYREGEDTGEVLRFTLDDLRRISPDAPVDWIGVSTSHAATAAVTKALTDAVPGSTGVPMTTRMSDDVRTFRVAVHWFPDSSSSPPSRRRT